MAELWQLHHQFKDRTEMCAQQELTTQDDMRKFFEETQASHPLPEGAMWLMVPEDSSHFWVTEKSDG